jgi:hypothetical protein
MDIIVRRMNLPPSAQQITGPRRQAAHLDSAIHRPRAPAPTYHWTSQICQSCIYVIEPSRIQSRMMQYRNGNHAQIPVSP